jgi:hypothetical protein
MNETAEPSENRFRAICCEQVNIFSVADSAVLQHAPHHLAFAHGLQGGAKLRRNVPVAVVASLGKIPVLQPVQAGDQVGAPPLGQGNDIIA